MSVPGYRSRTWCWRQLQLFKQLKERGWRRKSRMNRARKLLSLSNTNKGMDYLGVFHWIKHQKPWTFSNLYSILMLYYYLLGTLWCMACWLIIEIDCSGEENVDESLLFFYQSINPSALIWFANASLCVAERWPTRQIRMKVRGLE